MASVRFADMVVVIENYRGFVPSFDAKTAVEDLLESVRPDLLAGLRSVVLTNTSALTGTRKRQRGRRYGKKRDQVLLGRYYPSWNGEPAWIEVFVDETMARLPSWMLRIALCRTMFLAHILYHEVGHHIHATAKPEHRDREKVADDWRDQLSRAHTKRRYPITRAVAGPAIRVLYPLVRWLKKRWTPIASRQ
jgi:hypothetical protein